MYAQHSCAVPFQRSERQTREARRGSATNAKGQAASTKTTAKALMERDMYDQIQWLAHRANSYGYSDLDDLFGRAPAVYTYLAAAWRQAHPLPTMA